MLIFIICTSLSFTYAKIATGYLSPFFLMGIRLTITGILLLIWHRINLGPLPTIHKKDRILFFKLAFLGIYLFVALDMWSLAYISAGSAAFLAQLSLIFSAIFSYYSCNESISYKKWCAFALAIGGYLPLLTNSYTTNDTAPLISYPIIINCIAVALGSYGWVITRKLILKGYSALFMCAVTAFFPGIAALLSSIVQASLPSKATLFAALPWIALLIVISNIGVQYSYTKLASYYTAPFLSGITLLACLLTTIIDWFVYQETITWHTLAPFFTLSVALSIIYCEEKKLLSTT